MGKRKYSSSNEKISKKQKNAEYVEDIEKIVQPFDEVPRSSQEIKRNNVFDIKHFRKELSSKQGNTIALTQFLQVCLDPDSGLDYILEYLKSGGNSHEILQQISQDNKKNLTLATPAFHLFNLIILKVQSSLPHMIAITEEACRYFLNTFVSTVEIMISENSGPRHRKVILKLLTSMVTLNPDLGVEVLNQAPLTPKHLQHIVEKINYKEKDNVRTAFVHFMTSFLVDGHLPLIKALLEKQGLLSLVIPGLVQDEAETVLMFLHILKKNVIDNSFVSKSLKLKTFSHQVIHYIFKLFSWKGPIEVKFELKNDSRPELMQLVSDIILILFTSHKVGLYFVDKSLGSSDTNKNQNLYKALLTLKRPWENDYQCQVILDIIKCCPDLHRAVINILEQSFEPQHSPIWEKAVNFALKFLNTLKPEDMVFRLSDLIPSQVSNFVRFTTLPVPLLKYIQPNLSNSDITIALYCVKVLVKMLNNFKRYIQILQMDNLSAVADLKNKMEIFFPKHLPVPSVIVSLIQKIITNVPNEKSTNDYRIEKPNEGDSLISLIDLLLHYYDIHPLFFESLDGSLDIKEILKFSKNVLGNNISMLKFKIVSLWLALDNMAISLENPMFKELFLIMLQVYTNDDDNTWMEAKDTLYKFLKNTAIFEADETEIHIMLHSLRNAKVNPTIIVDIVEYVLNYGAELNKYIRDKINHIDIANESKQISLDTLFEDLMEDRNTDHTRIMENKVPSGFIVGCIHYLQTNKPIRKSLKHFLSLYIANLLHCNFSPELTQVLIGDCKLDVQSYVASWMAEPESISEDICGKDTTLRKISESIIRNADTKINDIFCDIGNINDESEITVDSSQLLVWAKYLIYCIVALTNINKLKMTRQNKIVDYFKVIMEICRKTHNINICRDIVAGIYKSSHILDIYTPLDFNKDHNVLSTNFLVDVVYCYREILEYWNINNIDLLKPFKQKNYKEVMKCLIKAEKPKNVNIDHTSRILQIVGLDAGDDVNTINQIFKMDNCCLINDNKEPSIALEVLRTIVSKYSNSVDLEFSSKTLGNILLLYTNIIQDKKVNANLTTLELTLIDYFDNKPQATKIVKAQLFKHFFYCNNLRKSTTHLAAVFLMHNSKLYKTFSEELTRPDVLGLREMTLPLGNAVTERKQFLSDKQLLTMIATEYKPHIFKMLEKPHKAGQLYIANWQFINKLLVHCTSAEDCAKFFSKNNKYEIVETCHVTLLNTLFLRMCLFPDCQKREHFINYLMSMLGILVQALKESKSNDVLEDIAKNIFTVCLICSGLKNFETDKKEDFQKLTDSAIWQNFCKSVLKNCLKVKTATEHSSSAPKLLNLLSTLVKLLYPPDHPDIAQLFDMVTSHSEFLNVMLSHHSLDIKSRVVELLFVLIVKDKSVMKGQQVPVYLSAYHATKSPCDRLILVILHFYETHGLAVHEYKPYVWGDSAANYYSVRKNRTTSLWSHPTPNQILNLFEKTTIENTVKNFPVTQKLDYVYELPPNIDVTNDLPFDDSVVTLLDKICKDQVFRVTSVKDNENLIRKMVWQAKYDNVLMKIRDMDLTTVSHNEKETQDIYDPAFLFPLLSHLLTPGSLVSCFKLLRAGLLSVPVVALSSHCPSMRAAAYHVLYRFFLQLETETKHKNDKLLLTDFLETLRHSLPSIVTDDKGNGVIDDLKNPRLPAIDAMYLARALMVATAPFDSLYKPVNNFLIAKQHLDFTTVPDFLSLFHDSDIESADRRLWILDVIKDGTKTMTDVIVVFKTMCLKMIMDFYSSVLSDRKTKEKILGVIASLASVPRASEILIEGYGLISWLNFVVRNMRKEEKVLVKAIVVVIRNIVYSMSINAFNRKLGGLKKTENIVLPIDGFGQLKLVKDVELEILIILHDLLLFVNNLELDDVLLYLSTLNLLSSGTIKSLTKRQVTNLVNVCAELLKYPDNFKLLVKAVKIHDANVLNSKLLCKENENSDIESVKNELIVIVKKYML